MPELPEVETVRKTLEKLITGKQIVKVTVSLPRIIQHPELPDFTSQLIGKTVNKVERRGKFLKIFCAPYVIVSHLRMEGKYRVVARNEPLEKHTHVIFHFSDDTELRYKDVRQFGTMHLFRAGEEQTQKPLQKLGIEPLSKDFTINWFLQRLAHRKTKIKVYLLNQEHIVGLGNIYVDEALFQAKIHPERAAGSLKEPEIKHLYKSIKQTLTKAIEVGGSSVRTYVDGRGEMGMFQLQIRVYGRKGLACFDCGQVIERIVVAGRGTHVCTKCQK